jgi:hypothetical protein
VPAYAGWWPWASPGEDQRENGLQISQLRDGTSVKT